MICSHGSLRLRSHLNSLRQVTRQMLIYFISLNLSIITFHRTSDKTFYTYFLYQMERRCDSVGLLNIILYKCSRRGRTILRCFIFEDFLIVLFKIELAIPFFTPILFCCPEIIEIRHRQTDRRQFNLGMLIFLSIKFATSLLALLAGG